MKIILAQKYLSKNPFTKYMDKNIHQRWITYHEDFKKCDEVAEKLRKDGYTVRVIEVDDKSFMGL